MRYTPLSRAPKPHPLTDIIPPLTTSLTLSTRKANFEGYTVARSELGREGRSDGKDDAGGFVAEGQGFEDLDVAVAVVGVVVEVAATETGGADLYLELTRIWRWKGAGF
jgi:hypothetical protein